MRQVVRSLLAVALLSADCVWAAPEDELRTLLDQGRPAEAFRFGQAHPERLGQPSFDFFYGIAAIESGQARAGVPVLERFVRDYPENRSARYQLAHGYYLLGEDTAARASFAALLPGAQGDEQAVIERFLDAIVRREDRQRTILRTFVEAGIGFDTNINAGVSSGSTPSIPGAVALPPLAAGALANRKEASFTTLTGQVSGIRPLAADMAVSGTLAIDARTLGGRRNDVFDQMSVAASGGVSHGGSENQLKLGLGLAQMGLDNQRYVMTTSLFGEWDQHLNRAHQIDLAAQIGRHHHDDMLVYPDAEKALPRELSKTSLRSTNFVSLNAGWTWLMDGEWEPSLRLAANYGMERNIYGRDDLSRNLMDLRASLGVAPTPRLLVVFGAGIEKTRHRDTYAMPGATLTRQDDIRFFEAGITYRFDRSTALKLEYVRQKQASNIDFYLYEREMLTLKLRRDFR